MDTAPKLTVLTVHELFAFIHKDAVTQAHLTMA